MSKKKRLPEKFCRLNNKGLKIEEGEKKAIEKEKAKAKANQRKAKQEKKTLLYDSNISNGTW